MPSFNLEDIDVEHFLYSLQIRNISKATAYEYKFSCPFSGHANGDEKASAYMNSETSLYFCHGCHRRGNAVTFASELLSISPLDATLMLKSAYADGYYDPDEHDMVQEVKAILNHAQEESKEMAQPILDEYVLDNYKIDWESQGVAQKYMVEERGFLPEILAEWEIGYSPFMGRVTIPVRDIDGSLIGIKARAIDRDTEPKYLVLGLPENSKRTSNGWRRYYPSRVVFGAHRVQNSEKLVVCEGELNAIAINQKTGRDAIAINGSHFSEQHAKIIRQIADSVVLFLDSDEAGEDAVWGYVNPTTGKYHPGIIALLKDFIPIYIVPDHAGKDPASMSIDEVNYCLVSAQSALLKSLEM